MKSLNHASAIGRYFLLMMAIPAMAYATVQAEKNEPQRLICTPEEASLITDKKSKLEEREYPEARADRFIITTLGNKSEVSFYPSYWPVFSDCKTEFETFHCHSMHSRLPSTGEFTYRKKSDSTIVFTSFLTFSFSEGDSQSAMTMGYCRPFKG